jgi:tRNA A-37 threonylcarbamoyl transferase component Bud32
MAAIFSRHGVPLNGGNAKLNYTSFIPFSLFIPPGSHFEPEIHCLELLRDLPGKRQVYLGQWGDRQIVAKVFAPHKRVVRHWQREERGIKIMGQRGILTPEILYSGPLDRGAGLVIVLPFITHAVTVLEKWMAAGNNQERIKLLFLLMRILAEHHQAGLIQRDLHLGNFLVKKEEIYTLDGSDITVYRKSVGCQKSLNNLGLLFAQFFPEYDELAEDCLSLYCQLRNFAYNKNLLQKLRTRIAVQRRKRKRKILRKIFRECSAIVARQVDKRRILCGRNYFAESMADFLADPDCYLNGENVELLKDGNSSTVVRLKIENADLVVKRYNIKDFRHGMKRSVARTRASRSWENAHLLGFYGIRTAQPVAMVECGWGSIPRKSYFISEYVEGISCSVFFKDYHYPEAEKEIAAEQVVDLLVQLQDLHISHGDLKASNIVMTQDGPVLLDLDAMRQYRTSARFKKAGDRDLQRFLLNWENDPEVYEIFIRQMKDRGLCP